MEAIARVCAAARVPLIVDEAHGAHLHFLPRPDGTEGGTARGDREGGGSTEEGIEGAPRPGALDEGTGGSPRAGGNSEGGTARAGDNTEGRAEGAPRPGALDVAPRAALDCGADLVVHSTHKMLSSLTQVSLLGYSCSSNVILLCNVLRTLSCSRGSRESRPNDLARRISHSLVCASLF